jgi:hypothetical protein
VTRFTHHLRTRIAAESFAASREVHCVKASAVLLHELHPFPEARAK